ncbi:hypothetical protein AGABI2DRAFT_190568 [Agaricus bisporus var. bisporus H97]|nr:hypothetical protein AGABI2DRAFT_190568 [Agaricus bisporus var. bisporus H97]EKV50164.1 hypothetical protein AGABI2DRAFT_190568 [Agaricus bisporus var. bisporus H97]
MFLPRAGFNHAGSTRSYLQIRLMNRMFAYRPVRPLSFKSTAGNRITYMKHVFGATAVAGIGLGASALTQPKILCEAPISNQEFTLKGKSGSMDSGDLPPPPQSSLSVYELSFGAVTGICAGVFIKKGAKAVAWFIGGIFVLLQYMSSRSLVKVDWTRMSSSYESLFYTHDAVGNARPPSIVSLWRWLVDFLTADFQPRASFIAGFALGLRVG